MIRLSPTTHENTQHLSRCGCGHEVEYKVCVYGWVQKSKFATVFCFVLLLRNANKKLLRVLGLGDLTLLGFSPLEKTLKKLTVQLFCGVDYVTVFMRSGNHMMCHVTCCLAVHFRLFCSGYNPEYLLNILTEYTDGSLK